MATSNKGRRRRDSESSVPSSPVPPEVLKKTRAVLLSCTKGVLLKRFSRDYSSLAGELFPWRRLGYPNMISMLQAMPEAVHFDYSQKDSDYKLHGVADSSSFFMPSWQLKTQDKIQHKRSLSPHVPLQLASQTKSSPPQSSKGHSRRRSNGGNNKSEVLQYNDKGLVSLFVRWRGSSPQKNLNVLNQILRSHVASVEEPVEVYVRKDKDSSSAGEGFVRFDEITKAQRVLDRLSNSACNGFQFKMVPGKMKQKGQSPTNSSRQNGPMRTTNRSHQNKSVNGSVNHSHKPETPSRSCDSHVTEKAGTPDTQIQYRFRTLINELDPDDNKSDSDDSSILDYLEWERILDPVPSQSQVVSRGPSKFSKEYKDKETECVMVSCDQSHDQTPSVINGDCVNHVISSNESHDQSWDVAPLRVSGPPPPNENGLILVHISEVVSPDLIWLQLSSNVESDMESISTLISNHRLKPLAKVSVGDYCCVRHSSAPSGRNSQETVVYKRALVEDYRESPIRVLRQANILLLDSGVQRKAVPMDDLLELPSEVHPSVVPPLATPCSLHGIESISEEGEGWSALDLQLLWKHLYHKKVYAKEIVVPQAASLATTPPSKSKHKTTAVELYLDPHRCVSVVDVLVQEGMNMDYAVPYVLAILSEDSNSSVGSPEPWEGGHVTKKTRKKLLDLPTVSENGLYDDCFDSEEPLPDLDDSLVKPKSCGEDGHVTPPELLIGQKTIKKSQTQPVSPWQAFQKFCDEFL